MKKSGKLLIAILCCFISTGYAQMAVVDAGTNAQLIALKGTAVENYMKTSSLLLKATSSLQTLNDMKSTYDEWNEAVRMVNNTIQSGKEIINISNKVSDIGDLYVKAITFVAEEEYIGFNDKELYTYVFTEILNKSLSQLESSLDVTSNGVFEMNDSERLTFLTNINKTTDECYSLMIYALKKLKVATSKAKEGMAANTIFTNSVNAVKN